MPGFQRSVLPLCRAVVPLCISDQNADWLSTNGRTAKIGFNPIRYGTAVTAVTAQRQAGTATAQNGMVETSNVILTALTEFLRNLCNGNGKTAKERWKLGIRTLPWHS